MSQFRVSLLIDANGKAAKVEIEAVGAAVRRAGAEVDGLASKGDKATKATTGLGKAAARADAEFAGLKTEIASLKTTIDTMTSAEARAVTQMGALAAKVGQLEARLGRGGRGGGGSGAAGSMGNLVAQFNDLGVMLAAGQNPLQLALQQGTQITQVIGPMGSAGAVKALGGAFLGMLNPMNLMVIGVIAGGAALFQWGLGALRAGQDTETFDEKLEGLTAAVSDYKSYADLAASSTADLQERFGSAGTEAQKVAAFLSDFARVDAIRELDGAVASLTEQFGGLSRTTMVADVNRLIPEIDQTFYKLREELNLTDIQAAEVVRSLEGLANAQTMGEKIAAADALNQSFVRVFGSVNAIPLPLFEAARNAGLLALQAAEIDATLGASTAALRERLAVERELGVEQSKRAVAEAAARRLADTTTAQQMLAGLQEEIALRSLAVQFGEDSAAVALLRAQYERAAFEELAASLGAAQDLKDRLLAAYDANVALASVDMASGIAAGANAAAQLASNLGVSVDLASRLLAIGLGTNEPVIYDPRDPNYDEGRAQRASNFGFQHGSVSPFSANRLPNVGGAGAGPSGGGSAVADETDRVGELIERLQQEAAIRAELDPVQQQMLRYREELAGATAGQRLEVEALIEAEQREAATVQAVQERWEYLGSTAYDALLAMAKGGESASDAMRNLGASLAEAVFQAAIMGQGPLGGLFGGTSIFSLIGGALGIGGGGAGAGIRGHAGGGMITGPGGGTSDDVLMWGSSGEMVMTARATARHRHELEAMNANAPIRGYAKGGIVGGAAAIAGAGSARAVPVQISVDVTGARGNAEIMEMVSAGVAQGMAQYDRLILPASVQRISADSRRIG